MLYISNQYNVVCQLCLNRKEEKQEKHECLYATWWRTGNIKRAPIAAGEIPPIKPKITLNVPLSFFYFWTENILAKHLSLRLIYFTNILT